MAARSLTGRSENRIAPVAATSAGGMQNRGKVQDGLPGDRGDA